MSKLQHIRKTLDRLDNDVCRGTNPDNNERGSFFRIFRALTNGNPAELVRAQNQLSLQQILNNFLATCPFRSLLLLRIEQGVDVAEAKVRMGWPQLENIAIQSVPNAGKTRRYPIDAMQTLTDIRREIAIFQRLFSLCPENRLTPCGLNIFRLYHNFVIPATKLVQVLAIRDSFPHVGVLGPMGTYSHQMAQTACPTARLHFADNFLLLLSGLCQRNWDLVCLPVYNTHAGVVQTAIDTMGMFPVRPIIITSIPISICLARNTDMVGENIWERCKILSHPHVLKQVDSAVMQNGSFLPCLSTADAVECVKRCERSLVLCHPQTALANGLAIIKKNVQLPGNKTFFLWLARC